MADMDPSGESKPGSVVKLFLGLALIIAGMLCFVTYDWPGGKFGLIDFLIFWFRELLVLGVFLLILAMEVIRRVRKKVWSGKK